MALPTDVADAKRSVTIGQATPGHARSGRTTPGHAQPRTGMSATDRRRLGKAIGGLVAIFLVLTIAGVAARSIHVTPVNTTSSTSTAGGAATGASAADVGRLSDATTATASATAALPAQMANIPTLPTPQQVSTVTGPYVDTLQLYEAVLAGTKSPAAADQADPRPRRPVAKRYRHLRRGTVGQAQRPWQLSQDRSGPGSPRSRPT